MSGFGRQLSENERRGLDTAVLHRRRLVADDFITAKCASDVPNNRRAEARARIPPFSETVRSPVRLVRELRTFGLCKLVQHAEPFQVRQISRAAHFGERALVHGGFAIFGFILYLLDRGKRIAQGADCS